MTWHLVAALVTPVATGLLVTFMLTDGPIKNVSTRAGFRVLQMALSIGIGLGVSSLLFFLFLVFFGRASIAMIACEAAVLIALLLAGRSRLLRGFKKRPLPFKGMRLGRPAFVPLWFYALLGVAALNFILRTMNHPHGGWDAWAMWNLRARFLFNGGANWERAFADVLHWSSADYPLLVSTNVARVWTYLGKDALIGPALIAFLFTFATLALLVAALHVLRGRKQAYAGGLILLATAYFIRHSAAQYADVPLGFYILATLVLLTLQDEAPETSYSLVWLIGLTAGFAAWTKNEGLLFVLCLVVARSLVAILRKSHRTGFAREARAFLLALAPVLLILLYFKIQWASPNSLMAGQGLAQTTARLADLSRPAQIGQSFFQLMLRHDGLVVLLLPAYAGFLGVDLSRMKRPGVLTSVLVVLLILCGYFLVFLITPANLSWHLEVSLKRLLLQLWPAAIFLSLMIIRPPDEPSDKP